MHYKTPHLYCPCERTPLLNGHFLKFHIKWGTTVVRFLSNVLRLYSIVTLVNPSLLHWLGSTQIYLVVYHKPAILVRYLPIFSRLYIYHKSATQIRFLPRLRMSHCIGFTPDLEDYVVQNCHTG